MALLRLAERISLANQSQGRKSCQDKTPPRADQANFEPPSSSDTLGTSANADSADALQRTEQDARSSIACNRSGAER